MMKPVKELSAARAGSGQAPVGIGSTVWVFDINRRSYNRPEPGRIWGTIIWREHWGQHKIVAETARSWVLDRQGGMKVPKTGADPSRFAFSQIDIDRRAWIEDNRHEIERAVGRLQEYDILQAVAKLVGYRTATQRSTQSGRDA